jgi:Dockerin type I domain
MSASTLLARGGAIALTLLCVGPVSAGDISVVPLFNGERNDMLDLWGGPFGIGPGASLTKQSSIVNSGSAAYQLNVGSIASGDYRFFQAFSSKVDYTQLQPGGDYVYRQDRDLTQYQSLQTYVRNNTGTPFTLTVELKDYRDSSAQLAERSFSIPAGGAWTQITAPLDLSSGWSVTGAPNLTRTFALTYKVVATSGPVSGSVYFDDANLIEKGASIDVPTAPIYDVVERLAKRQFLGLWAARNKTSGLIPNSSDNVAIGALNTTTGVVWNLPAAVRRGWVTQSDADTYMGQLVSSVNSNRNQTTYLPTRFLDLVTAAPVTDHEESSIDASFFALALHKYKSQPATPAALRTSIDALENRFDFSAFSGPGAFKQAYFQPTGQFNQCGSSGPCTYSGYTNENKVIALAASVSTSHNVPLASMWNKDTGRTATSLVTPENYLVYSFDTQYRAPFTQALLNLFVDTSDRGADNYPTRSLARNPWENFVRYETDAAAKLTQLGRPNFMQPDAGAGAGTYQPWNLYNNFGQPNLFQPWSVAEMLMSGAPGAENALRFLLDNGLGTGLDGPQGLADSAQWVTGAANPTSVPSFADNWNVTLSTMALLAYLDGADRQNLFFANLPEVRAALNTVFVAGDYNGDGLVNAADYTSWRGAIGSINSLAADGNNDGVVNAADYVIWRKSISTPGMGAAASVPEPGGYVLMSSIVGICVLRASWRGRKTR